MNKILVCMWYDKEIEEYASVFRKVNEGYCRINNYNFFYSDKKYTDKPSPFNKVDMLRELLEKNEYDYYVWIDADAHFCRETPLENYIENHIDKDFIWSGDITPNINTGFFIVKNTQYSKNFLKLWSETDKTTTTDWWEQGVFTKMWIDNDMDIREHSQCFRYGVLQHFKNQWHNLVYHMAGTSKNDRIQYSKSKLLEYLR